MNVMFRHGSALTNRLGTRGAWRLVSHAGEIIWSGLRNIGWGALRSILPGRCRGRQRRCCRGRGPRCDHLSRSRVHPPAGDRERRRWEQSRRAAERTRGGRQAMCRKGRKKARAAKNSPMDGTDNEGQAGGERESTLSVKTPTKISSEIGPSRARHSAPHGEKQEGAWS